MYTRLLADGYLVADRPEEGVSRLLHNPDEIRGIVAIARGMDTSAAIERRT